MNKVEMFGSIMRINSRSNDVFIFFFKSRDKYPIQIKVKKFRPKAVPPDVFAEQCKAFNEGDNVLIIGRLSGEKQTNAGGVTVQTTDGRDVYTSIINALIIHQVSASIMDEIQDAATPPAQQPSRGGNAPPAAQPRQASPAPSFTPIEGDENDSDLPTSPFAQH